jgi:Flp pilus assembly protein TadD
MRRTRIFSLLAMFTLLTASLSAQRSSPSDINTSPDLCDVNVRVVLDNGQPAGELVRVELQTGLGVPLYDGMTNSLGQVQFRGVPPGNYRVKAEGHGLQEGYTEFAIQRRQYFHSEVVRVRVLSTATPAASGSISAADLKAPRAAQEAFTSGNQALQKRQLAQARKHFERALELYPSYPSALNNLGLTLDMLELPADARAAFERAITEDGRFARPFMNLGRLLIKEQDWENAEAVLLKAAALEPNNADTLTMLCNAQLRIGKLDDVVANAARVHALEHSRFAFAHFLAAVALQNKQMPAEAAAEYRVYLKESPNGPNAESAKKALAKLQ